MHEDDEPNARNLEQIEEGMHRLEESGESDVASARARKYDEAMHVDVHVVSVQAKGWVRKLSGGDMMMINETCRERKRLVR